MREVLVLQQMQGQAILTMLPSRAHNTTGYGPTNMQAMLQSCVDVNQIFHCFLLPGESNLVMLNNFTCRNCTVTIYEILHTSRNIAASW